MKLYNPDNVKRVVMGLEVCPVCLERMTDNCWEHIQQFLVKQKMVDGPVPGYRAFICSCNTAWIEDTDDCFSKDPSRCDECKNVVLPASHIPWTVPQVPVGMTQIKAGYVCEIDHIWQGNKFVIAADEIGMPVAAFPMVVRCQRRAVTV